MSLKTVKDKLHYFMVQKNDAILHEYQQYRDKYPEKHLNERYKTWILIIKLNLKYRILKEIPKEMHDKINMKLPYLEGAESQVYKRPNEYQFVQSLLSYNIISFDIFDTLILRPFAEPHDMFIIVGEKLDCLDFTFIRREAEKKARENSFIKYGHYEINIYDIYEIIEKETGIDKNYGVKIEFETELEFCFPNPYMKRVFDMLIEQGKKIIIVSDMYLPRELMSILLEKNGFNNYKELYVSCDYKCSKRHGNLYEIIIRDINKDEKIVHIGDNIISDIDMSSKYNIDNRYYKNVHEIGNRYRADGMSCLVGSVYSGIINTHLHNGTKQYNSYYEYGFIYGGLYVLGYCNWIYNKAKDQGIDKILFLSRDGDIYKQMFDMFYSDISSEYVYWSRIANCKYSSKFQRQDVIKKLVDDRAYSIKDYTIESLLKDFNLQKLEEQLSKYNLDKDTLIDKENINTIRDFLYDNWEIFEKTYDIQRDILKAYFNELLKDVKKIALVDVGWMGSGPLGIKKLIQDEWKIDCEIECFVAGFRNSKRAESTSTLDLKGTIQPYIFSYSYNRGLYDYHSRTNKRTNNVYFELFTQAQHPSFSGISNYGEYLFDIPEVENYEMISEMHKGIIDFSKIYINTFKDFEYMFNISGHDAYCAFRMSIRDLRLIKNNFSNFKFAFDVGGDDSSKNLGSIIDLINVAKL